MLAQDDQLHKVHLTKTQETLLITLYAKALDSRSSRSILHDSAADKLVRSIDFDFEKLKGTGTDNVLVVRARQYDEWVKEFLAANPGAVVVNLGCGLDTRVSRINPASNVRWFDVDFPEVIQLRANFYSNSDEYRMIGSSITDPKWLEEIPADRPTIIVAEGVLEYLSENDVKTLFNRITDHFLQGQIAFDVMNTYAIKSAQSSYKDDAGAIHKWAVDDLSSVDQLDGKLRRIAAISLFSSSFMGQLPVMYRLLYGSMARIPKFKNMVRLCRYQF